MADMIAINAGALRDDIVSEVEGSELALMISLNAFTGYDISPPYCRILKLNSSKKDITYSESYTLPAFKTECVPGKNVPLTHIESDTNPENLENGHVLTFNIRVNLTALRLHFGGADNFQGCEYQKILRDYKSNSPDNVITFTKPISFKYQVGVRIYADSSQTRHDVNRNFDFFVRVKCFDKKKSVIYRNVHTAACESVSHYVNCHSSKGRAKESMPKFNILLVGIDSTSNKNFERSLVETYQYLTSKRKKVFRFEKYAKIADNTYPNLNALLTGRFVWENNPNGDKNYFDNTSLIWREYEKSGYSSIFLEDEPDFSTYNYLKKGFYKPPSNFYSRPFSLEWQKVMSQLSSSSSTHCSVYGKNEVEMLLDYSKSLIQEMEKSNHPISILTLSLNIRMAICKG
ncbi:uncharacterized protein LOC135930911 [Gordionus sp. m RMFG-2023]|uniref:uncharacterized protein LOC135930911 n=1 Tax=Gordionus sp. m RMFG-2023 TaxID=3053472 RepID=UPI0031FCE255